MNNLKKILGVLMIIFVLNSCKKDNNGPSSVRKDNSSKQLNASPVSISGFTPASGIIISALTINGADFSTNTTDNVVKINGITAKVLSATSTQLTVTVPPGASTGNISVTTAGNTATSATTFKVLNFVKDGAIAQTATPVTALSIDNTGNTFAVVKIAHYQAVVKNGPHIFFRTKNDTTTKVMYPNGNETGTITQYSIVGVMNDAQGNTFVAVDQYVFYYDVYNYDDSKAYTISVYKITPDGVVTSYIPTLTYNKFYEPSGFALRPVKTLATTSDDPYDLPDVQAFAMNTAGDIYYYDLKSNSVKKYGANGVGTNNTYAIANTRADNLTIDADGYVYANAITNTLAQPYSSNIIKADPVTGNSVVTIAPGGTVVVSDIAVDAAKNLFVARGSNMQIINAAGDRNSFNTGIKMNGLTFDNLGRLYFITDSGIARYSFK